MIKDIKEINKYLSKITNKQDKLNEEIIKLADEKNIFMSSLIGDDFKEIIDLTSRIGSLSYEKINDLNSRFVRAYKQCILRVFPERVMTKFKYPKGCSVDSENNIVVNYYGIGYPSYIYNSDEYITRHVFDLPTLIKVYSQEPNLRKFVGNMKKKYDIYDAIAEACKDWKLYKCNTKLYEDVGNYQALEIDKFYDERGINNVYNKPYKYLEINESNNKIRIDLKPTTSSYYWQNKIIYIDGNQSIEDYYLLYQLPDEAIKIMNEYVDKSSSYYLNNCKVYEKMERKLLPYLALNFI